jgi:hypothetical protein
MDVHVWHYCHCVRPMNSKLAYLDTQLSVTCRCSKRQNSYNYAACATILQQLHKARCSRLIMAAFIPCK